MSKKRYIPENTPYNYYKDGEAPDGWLPLSANSEGDVLPTVDVTGSPRVGSVAWNDQHPVTNTVLDFTPIVGDIKGLTYDLQRLLGKFSNKPLSIYNGGRYNVANPKNKNFKLITETLNSDVPQGANRFILDWTSSPAELSAEMDRWRYDNGIKIPFNQMSEG